jgi:hypothetical protein
MIGCVATCTRTRPATRGHFSGGADNGQVADAITQGLQVFGKAWYRARALRVFRDNTSLAATSNLWSALEQALQSSRFLIVLASPAAAASPWVNREITAFLRHRGAERVLLAVTDGEAAWDERAGDFAPDRSTAVPPALFGVFSVEPRWVDLRSAKTHTRLTLRDPWFADALVSLAAALHEVPRDYLVGEDVRQHRRIRRLVTATVAALTSLTVLSAALAVALSIEWQGVPSRPQFHVGNLGWILAGVGATALLVVVSVSSVGPWLGSRLRRAPPDLQDSPTHQRAQTAAAGKRFLLLEFLRAWMRRRREFDLYIGVVGDADRELAGRLAEAVRRLGRRRLRWGRLRVVVEKRSADAVDNLSESYGLAMRARHYLHLASPDTVGSEAGNLILQEWLRVHPPERLLLGIARLPEGAKVDRRRLSAETVLPRILRASPTDLSGRIFDLRGFQPYRSRLGHGGEDLPELARLIGRLLGVDPHLVANGGRAVLRMARRRSKIEEPLERWNLSETVQLRAQAEIAVHLPEVQAALAALGQSPLTYFVDVLANEDDLILREVAPRTAQVLVQSERNAARETGIRIGRLHPRKRRALRTAGFDARRQRVFLSRYAMAVAAAVDALRDAMLGSVILPFLRKRLNEELSAVDGLITVQYDSAALTSQTLDRFRLETAAHLRTAARVETPGGAAIGLAGPRGVGKTTLLSYLTRSRLFHDPESPGSQVGALVSAPVRYESIEFLPQVLAAVCREVIRAGGAPQRLAPHGYLTTASTIRRLIAAVLLVATVAAVPVVAGRIEVSGRQIVLCALASVALVSATVAFDLVSATRRLYRRLRYTSGTLSGAPIARSSRQRIRDLTAAAGTILNRLYFREERSLSAGLRIPGPLGIEANGGGNLLYEGRPWTTPEISQQFRQFVGALNDSGYRVIIAVDELDKVDDDEEVIRLLNDLKVLFGLANCYFLVAVSISAMIRFQQRGLPFQDAFDSALDEVIYVEPLSAAETVELLQRRLTGIPTASALLCHVVGGGLPRDVIRALRNLAAASGQAPHARLPGLVIDDLHTRLAAARTHLQIVGRDTSEPMRRILDLTQFPFDSRKWLEVLDPILVEIWQRIRPDRQSPDGRPSEGHSPEGLDTEDRERDRLMLFIDWAVTAAEFASMLTNGSDGDPSVRIQIADELAACRRLLAVDLRDAFESLAQIRAALGMTARP